MMIKFLIIILIVCADAYRGGVYLYRKRSTGSVAYVGMTNNFKRRHGEHIRNNRYFTGNNYRMDKFYVDKGKEKIEKYYIQKYAPEANILNKPKKS
jgi:uncharacterized protein YxeA